MPVVKLCAEPRCGRPRLTNHWTARCELHAKAYSRAKDARRSSANPTYRRLLGSTEYQAAKELVRRRDRTCRMADGTCRGPSEEGTGGYVVKAGNESVTHSLPAKQTGVF